MVGSFGAVLPAAIDKPLSCGCRIVLYQFPGRISCNLRVWSSFRCCAEFSPLFEIKATVVPQQGSPSMSSDALQDTHRWQNSFLLSTAHDPAFSSTSFGPHGQPFTEEKKKDALSAQLVASTGWGPCRTRPAPSVSAPAPWLPLLPVLCHSLTTALSFQPALGIWACSIFWGSERSSTQDLWPRASRKPALGKPRRAASHGGVSGAELPAFGATS